MGFVHYHDGILHLAARYTRSVIREETKPLSGLKCAVMGSVMKLKNLRLQLYKLFLLSGFSFQIFWFRTADQQHACAESRRDSAQKFPVAGMSESVQSGFVLSHPLSYVARSCTILGEALRLTGHMAGSGKRKSNGGGGAPKPKASKGDAASAELKVPVECLLQASVQRFDAWLCLGGSLVALRLTRARVLTENQSIDVYLAKTLGTEARDKFGDK